MKDSLFICLALIASMLVFDGCVGGDPIEVTTTGNSTTNSTTNSTQSDTESGGTDNNGSSTDSDGTDSDGTDTGDTDSGDTDDQTGTGDDDQTDTEEEQSYTANIVGGYTGLIRLYKSGVYAGYATDVAMTIAASDGDYVTLTFEPFSVGDMEVGVLTITSVYVATADEVTYTLSGTSVSGSVNSSTRDASVTFTLTVGGTSYTAIYSTSDDADASGDGTGSGYNNGGEY